MLPVAEPGTRTIRVVGMDPSLRNWGIAMGTYELTKGLLTINGLSLVNPVLPKGKQVRQNSLDLESAYQLSKCALEPAKYAHAVFVEVPVGSQSARAMASYGICVGVLGAMRAAGIPFFEVTPTEVKLAACGRKDATKEQMIAWATSRHPEANWPIHAGQVSAAKAEHMADAVAAIYAGVASNPFRQTLPFLESGFTR